MPRKPAPTREPDVFTLQEFADSMRLSVDQIKRHMDGELPPLLIPDGYSGTKPLFYEETRSTFKAGLPKEPVRPKRVAS